MPEIKKYLAPLFCKIPNDELREYGKVLAEQVQKCTDEEIRQGVQRKLMKEVLEHLEEERDRLARIVADGVEKRDVECVVQADYVMMKAYTMRMDTGEIIDERALKEDERQIGLKIEETDRVVESMRLHRNGVDAVAPAPQSAAVQPQPVAPATQADEF